MRAQSFRLVEGAALLAIVMASCAEPTPIPGRTSSADAGAADDGDDGDDGDDETSSVCNLDGECGEGEDCGGCSADCGICEVCKSDGACEADNACAMCPDLCGSCGPTCNEPAEPTLDPRGPTLGDGAHPDEGHNAGMACLTCHTPTLDIAPPFVLAGTLYTDATGTSPRAGASVVITDATGTEFQIVTSGNGNFWSSNPDIEFPINMRASSCPETVEMPPTAAEGQPAAVVGNCNSCHTGTENEELGTVGRIELPL